MNDTPAEREEQSIWARLRRRKVVQWGLVYVAAAWGFLQGLEYLSGTYDWPRQIQQLTTLALLIGLPVVLVLAWYHGDRGQQRVTTPEFAILTLLLLLGGGALWYYQRESEASRATSSPAAVAAAIATDTSIAVLPFVNLSPDKDQEYFADGISEELLNLLAQVPDLKVIARTSSFAFKGEKIGIAEIAKKLNVAHVVEGSIRKSGNKLRITAQLVRAADSTHVWSATYDRPLDDIFAVQDEIAGAIVQALQIRLAGGELNRRKGGTQNLEAYRLYLRALSALNQNTKASLDAAGEYAEQAIKLDPSYGRAWMLLAWIVSTKTDNGWLDATEGYERAREVAQHALQVSPDIAEAHAQLQYVYQTLDWDWSAAKVEEQRALAIDPTNPVALTIAGILSYTLGRWDDAERQLRTALVRDPLNTYALFSLGVTYYLARRFAEAEGVFRKLLELEPDFGWSRRWLSKSLLAEGKPEAALAMVQEEADEADRLAILPILLHAVGRRAEADEALQAQIAQWADTGAYFRGL